MDTPPVTDGRLTPAGCRETSRTAARLFVTILVAIVGLGVILRLKGVATLSLWLDETLVDNALSSGGGVAKYFRHPMVQRPLLYLMLSEGLLAIRNTELFARLTSLLPSILALLLIGPLSLRIFKNRAVVILSVFLLAVNPYLINAAKEFKPYALEHFLTLLMLFFVLCWQQEREKRYLYAYCVTALFAPLLGNPFLFVIPSFSLLMLTTLPTSPSTSLKWSVLAATLAGMGWYVGLYFLVLRHLDTSHVTTFEENLYPGGGIWQGITWVSHHLWTMLATFVPGRNFLGYDSMVTAVTTVLSGAGLLFFGVRVVLKREWSWLPLLLLPILLSAVVSILFQWPFGVARTNIYAISLLIFLTLIGIEYFLGAFNNKPLHYAIVSLLCLMMFPYHPNFYDYKQDYYWTPSEEFVPAVTALINSYNSTNPPPPAAGIQPKPLLVLNYSAESQFTYYTKHHSTLAARYRSFFSAFDIKFIQSRDGNEVGKFIAQELTRNESVYFLFSHFQPQEIRSLLAIVNSQYVTKIFEHNFPQAYLVQASFQRR